MINEAFIENTIKKEFSKEFHKQYALKLFMGLKKIATNEDTYLSTNELNNLILDKNNNSIKVEDFWVIVLNLAKLRVPIFELVFWITSEDGRKYQIKDQKILFDILEKKEIEDPKTGKILNADVYMERMILLFKINNLLFNQLYPKINEGHR